MAAHAAAPAVRLGAERPRLDPSTLSAADIERIAAMRDSLLAAPEAKAFARCAVALCALAKAEQGLKG